MVVMNRCLKILFYYLESVEAREGEEQEQGVHRGVGGGGMGGCTMPLGRSGQEQHTHTKTSESNVAVEGFSGKFC